MKTMVNSFKWSLHTLLHSVTPHPAAVPPPQRWPTPPSETPGHSQATLGQSLLWLLLLSPGSWCAHDFVCVLQESVSSVLCKLWWLCVGAIGDLLQEGLCHTQICCTQSPCPCGRPLLTWTSTGDSQTLKGLISVSVGSPSGHKVLFEPSEHFWWVEVWF